MPFIGQDWRSPGEVWIKTNDGWEPMKLLHKSHFVRHHYHIMDDDNSNCVSSSSSTPSPSNFVTTSAATQLSSSLDSNVSSDSTASSATDSDSESDLTTEMHPSSDPVPVPGKRRHTSGDSISSLNSTEAIKQQPMQPLFDYSVLPDGVSMADIIQRLQRSSSQPIPMDILKESSEQIEIYHEQPYYRITLNPTREVQGSNIISDAFYKLDFCNAIRDIRRFAYVSKLLHLLITQNLTSLSGNATKALFWMLEEIAKQVASNKQNIHVIRELLIEIREIVDKYLCWGRPLGSTVLWEQHLRTMERICEMTDAIEIAPPDDDDKASWSELPEELIREILLRLSDYKDLKRSAEACERMNSLLNEEQHIWKQLVKYHFTKDQLRWAFRMNSNDSSNLSKSKSMNQKSIENDSDNETFGCVDQNGNNHKSAMDWERLFHLLRKKFGLKEEYADCLFLCRYCRCLFWKSKNHPCILENPDLTRQVLVTSPMTGFKSTQNVSKCSVNNASLQSNNNNHQQPLAALLRSRSLALNSNNNNNNNNRPLNGPVMVQNLPFFEHPLVIQRQRQNDQNNDNNSDNNNNDNNAAQMAANNATTTTTTFKKTPLHVPITPEAFLKFFSL